MFNKITITTDGATHYITDSNLFNVKYQQDVNNDDNVQVGITASASLKFETDVSSSEIQNLIDYGFTYHLSFVGSAYVSQMGKFQVVDVVKKSDERYQVTAYDTIYKFNKIVDDWVDNIVYPITVANLFESLCSECGVQSGSSSFINSDFVIKQQNFRTINVTGRQVLGYIAGVAGGFAYADTQGLIKIGNYRDGQTFSITNSELISCEIKDYQTPIIDKVWVAQEESDMGVSSGTGNQVVRIEYNPLLLAATAEEIQTQVDNIYNLLHTSYYSYYPATIETFGVNNHTWPAGSQIIINGKRSIIMSKEISQNGVIYSSTGDKTRPASNDSTIPQIQALRGKTHSLQVSVEGIQDIVTDKQTGNAKVLTWDANSGLVVCDDVTGNTVKIDGDNIAANAITAGKINTGAIEFNNFSEACKTRISSTSDIPRWAQGTYIDFSEVSSPTIKGQDIILAGGTFDVMDLESHTNFGSFGLGTNFDGRQYHSGVILSNSDNRYVFITDNGIILKFDDYGIRIDSTGVYRMDSDGETSIGPATFA